MENGYLELVEIPARKEALAELPKELRPDFVNLVTSPSDKNWWELLSEFKRDNNL